MKYTGSCHCGRVAFEVDGTIDSAPRENLRLTTPESSLSTYTFNKHVIKHRFCSSCGIHPFGEGIDAKGNARAAINIRCLDGIDLEKVPATHFDGRSH